MKLYVYRYLVDYEDGDMFSIRDCKVVDIDDTKMLNSYVEGLNKEVLLNWAGGIYIVSENKDFTHVIGNLSDEDCDRLADKLSPVKNEEI